MYIFAACMFAGSPAHGTANLRASHAAEAPVADLLDGKHSILVVDKIISFYVYIYIYV